MRKQRNYHFTRLVLDKGSPNSPTGFYADEVILKNGEYVVVRGDIYEIDTSCLIDRLLQVKKIDKLLREKDFRNYASPFSFDEWVNCLFGAGGWHGSLGEQLCERRYINNNGQGTMVSVEESPIMDGLRIVKKSLSIEVHGRGSFEDYVGTCNLFRKFFGLEERIVRGKENKKTC